jgi:hypothetical protein
VLNEICSIFERNKRPTETKSGAVILRDDHNPDKYSCNVFRNITSLGRAIAKKGGKSGAMVIFVSRRKWSRSKAIQRSCRPVEFAPIVLGEPRDISHRFGWAY